MHLLNRVHLIGYIDESPRTFLYGKDNVMIFYVSTKTRQTPHPFTYRHQIIVEDQLMITYVQDRIVAGSLVYLEGILQYDRSEGEDKTDAWILIAPNNGVIHPLQSQ